MAEELVTSLIKQLGSVSVNEAIQQMRLVRDVTEEIDKLTISCRAIKVVINDAEGKQTRDDQVRVWLELFKEVAYDIEDVLDEWITKTQIRSLEIEGAGCIRKVTSLLLTPLIDIPFKCGIATRIVKIRERLDFIASQRDKHRLISHSGNSNENTSSTCSQLWTTTSKIEDSEICGRDQDKNNILNKLLGINSTSSNHPEIISIVGMGGLGKTTLAQTVFNHHKVKGFFEKTMWVSVSNPFDMTIIAKSIIEEVDKNIQIDSSVWDNNLQKTLCESLEGKRFLLVLDDVWNEDENKWNPLKLSLKHGAPGSRILVTTRSERVARIMGTTHRYRLGLLSDDDCCLLLSRIAFQEREEEECHQLRELSVLFGKRCKGLPLAAKTLGSLLCFKKTKREWVSVSDSNVWELVDAENEYLMPALLLSYNELSSPLKSCFQYCSTLRKGYVIKKDKLIKLWMAYGLLNSCGGSEDLEFVGEGYYNALAMRSLFHNFIMDDFFGESTEYCKMHDILHDLAHFLLNNKFCNDEVNNSNLSLNIDPKAHHVTLIDPCPQLDDISFVYKVHKLRTLNIERFKLPFPHSLNHLRYLRVLSLQNGIFGSIPDTIKELVHLRYLDLSHNSNLKYLPDSICSLYNLQTLKLNDCNLHQLPRGIGRMVSLRHLEIERTFGLKSIPEGVGRLSLLRTLPKFIIGCASGESGIGELKNLNLLQGKLEIHGFDNLKNIDEGPDGILIEKRNLTCLTLNFYPEKMYKQDLKVEELFEKLQPHSNLAKMEVKYYTCGNLTFPSWMRSNSVLLSLRVLQLKYCHNCTEISALGFLPSLEELFVCGIVNLTHISMSGSKVNQGMMKFFPKLKFLNIHYMDKLEELDLGAVGKDDEEVQTKGGRGECVIMPCLDELHLYNCKKLKSSPYHQHLIELAISGCPLISELPILPNLTYLTISKCQSISELPILPNLTFLKVRGGIISHLPVLLNLTTLRLHDCPSISQLPILPKLSTLMCFSYKCNDLLLPKGISQLKQLQILKIEWYDLLTSIPEYIRHLTNLKELHIYTESLEVLQERCRKDQGEDWNVISHIPNVVISCPFTEKIRRDVKRGLH